MKNGRGQAIGLMAQAMVGLIAVVGMAIDGGCVYELQHDAQDATDSAAMAAFLKLSEYIS